MNQIATAAPAIDRSVLVSSMFDIAKRPFYAANGWTVLNDVSADELDTVIGKRVRTVRGAARQVLNRLIKPAKANTETAADAGLQQTTETEGEKLVADVLSTLNGTPPAAEEPAEQAQQ